MKSFSKTKLVPIILIVLIAVAAFYIAFNRRGIDDEEITDMSSLVEEVTPLINTVEIKDGKTEEIKGKRFELPEAYSFISIVNQSEYRNYKCESESCLIYIVQGNGREFVISTSEVTNTSITNSLKEQNINLRGEDRLFRVSTYSTVNDDGVEQADDTRFEYITGCIDNMCYSSDPMTIFDKDTNSTLVDQFKNFINDLKIT